MQAPGMCRNIALCTNTIRLSHAVWIGCRMQSLLTDWNCPYRTCGSTMKLLVSLLQSIFNNSNYYYYYYYYYWYYYYFYYYY